MRKITEISKTRFNRADDQKTLKGSMVLDGKIMYGFFVKNSFYYTVSGKYYSTSK